MSAPIDPQATASITRDANASAAGSADETAPHGAGLPKFGPPAAEGEAGTLGSYRVVKELGKGGMGAVYLAVDTHLGRQLALKVMLPEFATDRDAKERFLREARAAAQVNHENVVTVFEAAEIDGVPYIAMQLLKGAPLDKHLKQWGDLPLTHLLGVGREAALGLAAAHEQGLVHRDIKPANLWLEAPNGRVKVLDFGLARSVATDADLTRTGAVLGTPAFMSPEQARGLRVDHRTDLFSLGAVLYRLVAGRNPFVGPNPMAVLVALGTEDPPPLRDFNPGAPESLVALVHQMLAKDPDHRPQTAAEVAERLRAIAKRPLAPSPVPAAAAPDDVFARLDDEDGVTEAEPAPAVPERKRNRWGVALAVAAPVLLVVAALIAASSGARDKPAPPPLAQGAALPAPAPAPTPTPTPIPVAKVPPAAAAAAAAHSLLAEVDPDRDALLGNWSREGDALVVPVVPRAGGSSSFLAVPLTPPDEYDLAVVAERRAGVDGLMVQFPVDGCRVQVILDGAGGRISGMSAVDGKPPWDNPTRTEGAVLPPGQAVRLEFAVRKGRASVSADGRRLFEWTAAAGPLSDKSPLPRSARLALGGWESSFRVTELTLKPAGDPAVAAAPGDALARAVLRRGGAVEGTTARGENLRVSDAAELPAGLRVRTLHLGPSGFNWDAALARLPKGDEVEVVRADHADLTAAAVGGLAQFRNLRELGVAGSRLTDADLDPVARLTGLKVLRVGQGQFSGPALDRFRAARPGCEVVVVAADRVAAEAVLTVNEHLPAAYKYSPAEVRFRTPDGKAGAAHSTSALPAEPFRVTFLALPQLHRVSGWRVAAFRDLPELESVAAWGNDLTNEALARWDALPKLRNVNLGRCRGVTTAGVRSLARFPTVTDLNLQHTGLDDTAAEALTGFPKLTEVYLNGTRVGDASVPALARLTGLRKLGLTRGQLTAAGGETIRRALPDCEIWWEGAEK